VEHGKRELGGVKDKTIEINGRMLTLEEYFTHIFIQGDCHVVSTPDTLVVAGTIKCVELDTIDAIRLTMSHNGFSLVSGSVRPHNNRRVKFHFMVAGGTN